MSEKKMFTAEEVARMLLEKAHSTLKKHEDLLQKSKNTAHEIDAGEEPNNDEAECPESLKGEGSSGASKSESNKNKSPVAESEDSEMEDEPLSDDSDEDKEESEEDESEEDESEEDEYEFKKSESGMHTVEYKTLKKFGSQGAPLGSNLGSSISAGIKGVKKEEDQPAAKENPQYHIRATQEGKTPKKEWTTATRKEVDYSRSGMKGAKASSPEDQKRFEAEAKERAKKFKEQSKK